MIIRIIEADGVAARWDGRTWACEDEAELALLTTMTDAWRGGAGPFIGYLPYEQQRLSAWLAEIGYLHEVVDWELPEPGPEPGENVVY